LPDLGCDDFCLIHAAYYSPLVDIYKATICRLQRNSHWVDQ
jgi:hypothetical protein